MGANDRLFLFRRRLTTEARAAVLKEVGASHIVGDDPLCPNDVARGGPLLVDFWKKGPKYRWGDAHRPHPLVVFPDHLVRLHERVAWEFSQNSDVAHVSVLVTVPRHKVDAATDGKSFFESVDTDLVEGWGEGLAVVSAVCLLAPVKLQHFPASEVALPPASWDEKQLPVASTAVVLIIGRCAVRPPSPAFRQVGTFATLSALKAKAREGLARIVLEVDLVQRPRQGRADLQAFGRKAIADLITKLPNGAALPALPPHSLRQRGDKLEGLVDLPRERAAQLLGLSGSVRGVFVRPFLPGSEAYPLPPGFTPTSHRIIWAKMGKFSDLIFAALQGAKVAFAGLVCPRTRGEVGVRVLAGSDPRSLRQCLETNFAARVKVPGELRRTTLRASVPLAYVEKLPQFLSIHISADLQLLATRVVRTSPYSMVVDLEVMGPALTQEVWRCEGIGMRPVVVKKLERRSPPPVVSRVSLTAPVPQARRPLTSAEQRSWADVAAGARSAPPVPPVPPAPAIDEEEEVPVPNARRKKPTPATAPPARGPAAMSSPAVDEEEEVPVPSKKKPTPVRALPSSQAPVNGAKQRGDITRFLAPAAPTRPVSSSSSSSASSSLPLPAATAGVDLASFHALTAKVEELSQLFQEQLAGNTSFRWIVVIFATECGNFKLKTRS